MIRHAVAASVVVLAIAGAWATGAHAVCAPQGLICGQYKVFPPCYIEIVGQSVNAQGVRKLDPGGVTSISIRDKNTNLPVSGVTVSLVFQECPDLHIASFQDNSIGEVLSCSPGIFSRLTNVTDVNGSAKFHVAGWGKVPSCSTPVLTSGIRVIVAGCEVGAILPYKIWDLDGNGIGANDLSIFLGMFGCGRYYGPIDYDNDNTVGANDQSILLGRFGSGTSSVNGPSVCGP